jgi:putative oxidoreductase
VRFQVELERILPLHGRALAAASRGPLSIFAPLIRRVNERNTNMNALLILVARLIFTAVFAMALFFKLSNIGQTAAYIGTAGFPAPLVLAWMAATFESALVLCLATGAWFRPAALAAGVYVVFLAFAFHGPSMWAASEAECGFFVDHFTFLAGLLYAAACGPGRWWVLRRFQSDH